ncbi:hypothetical protein CTAYLR_004266 [Chrysophaeum taylorii]|uniref:Glutamate-1-semialdehyde 2,1-aminomutase n=1 Tax=Chrysophaeum taylorii TaxID=2483200 RepID=A0AAD7XIU2_9STRA|nr:hypothetical protein CTAYLR_004266 [Chrysophaeum taylorii]
MGARPDRQEPVRNHGPVDEGRRKVGRRRVIIKLVAIPRGLLFTDDNCRYEGRERNTYYLSFITLVKGEMLVVVVVGGCAGAYLTAITLRWAYKRIVTVVAMDPTPYVVRVMAPILRSYSFTGEQYYAADGVDAKIAAKRKQGAEKLAQKYDKLMGTSAQALNETLRTSLSDIRFTDTNRVPFQFQKVTRQMFRVATIARASEGPKLIDVDNQASIDVSGSYGVNVCGYDQYKRFVDAAWKRCRALGPNVLGPVHPVIAEVLPKLKAISRKEEISFHMSGTEAMMCAIRLARFNTRRPLIVQFAGAYHGWWDGVQPGPGSERANSDVLYLKDMKEASLRVIRARASEIAAVLVSPLQGLNPGKPPPSDLVLLDAKARDTAKSRDEYRDWLHVLRATCARCDVPLIFDEVYTGFRMAKGGAQEYYGVTSDVVVYGKTLGGGLAVGVVCGPSRLMRRFDPERPLRVAYVIGTFSAAPLTVAAMAEFLKWLDETADYYKTMEKKTDAWIRDVNQTLVDGDFPIRLDNLTTVWTVLFKQPGRYHWMFQYYLRAENIALSWVGTGRCLFSLDFKDADFEAVKTAIVNAATAMRDDGWWDGNVTSKSISTKIAKELVYHTVGSFFADDNNNNNT